MIETKQPRYPSILRPSEKVLRFFQEELEPAHTASGGRLPTIKEVSKHLNVSISTVQAVFAELSRKGKLTTIPGRGTFLNEKDTTPAKPSSSRHTIAVLIYEMELTGSESTWGKEICAAMLREAANNRGEKLTIHPFFSDTHGQDSRLIRAEIAHSSAAIVFPGEHSARVAAEFQAQGRPVIYINQPSLDATANFVSPDFFRIGRQVGACWKATGRKNIVALLHSRLVESSSCLCALAGLEMEFQKSDGSDAELRYHSVGPLGETAKINACLESIFRKKTDAIYASGDFIALKVVDWLLARGIRVPEDVSVIGGTGLHPAHNASLACTVVQQPFEEIGIEAVRMAVRAIRRDNEPQPGKFLRASIRAERTTRKVENEWFRNSEYMKLFGHRRAG